MLVLIFCLASYRSPGIFQGFLRGWSHGDITSLVWSWAEGRVGWRFVPDFASWDNCTSASEFKFPIPGSAPWKCAPITLKQMGKHNCVRKSDIQGEWAWAEAKGSFCVWNLCSWGKAQGSISSFWRSVLLPFSSCQSPLSIPGIYKAPITSGSKWHGPPMEGSWDKIAMWNN